MGANDDTSFHVDLAALQSAADLLEKFESSAEQFIADVEQKVNNLHIGWHGDSATAHLEAQQRWKDGAQEMRTAVGQLRAILTTAHGNYSSAAATNTAMWQKS
jgi:WXG100 family type VII secretion target